MSKVALIRHTRAGAKLTILRESKDGYEMAYHTRLPKWLMRDIIVDKVTLPDKLDDSEHAQYVKALQTDEGVYLVKELKKLKSNELLNKKLGEEYETIPTKAANWSSLVKEMIETPLVSKNSAINHLVTISKREIYNFFVKKQLIIK